MTFWRFDRHHLSCQRVRCRPTTTADPDLRERALLERSMVVTTMRSWTVHGDSTTQNILGQDATIQDPTLAKLLQWKACRTKTCPPPQPGHNAALHPASTQSFQAEALHGSEPPDVCKEWCSTLVALTMDHPEQFIGSHWERRNAAKQPLDWKGQTMSRESRLRPLVDIQPGGS